MVTETLSRYGRIVTSLSLCVMLAACNTFDRIGAIGDAPHMTNIPKPDTYQSVTMPMPEKGPVVRQTNSLWQTGSRQFFKDQRAAQVGDIISVIIKIADTAKIENESKRGRVNSESMAAPQILGFEGKLRDILPDNVDPSNLLTTGSNLSNVGSGSVNRKEEVNLKVAAVITQVLPNGNLVLQGRQEVRINYELRDLQIAGVIRPADIGSDNTIGYDKIAEARISYGGRGQITDVQQPRYGSQILDIISPF